MNPSPSQVLLVEDDPRLPEQLANPLREDNIALTCVWAASEVFALVRKRHFDLILLDLGLPGVTGFDVLRRLKDAPETQSIPVIILSALDTLADKLRAFDLGATDYLTRPFEMEELLANIENLIKK